MESIGGWKISTGKHHILYKPFPKSKRPTRQSAQLPRADPALSPSMPAASSGGSGGGKKETLRKIVRVSTKRPKKVKKQPDLIRWVKDAVNNVVPSFLKKYFKKKDATEEGGAVPGTCQNCQSPPPPPPNGSELGPPCLDGPYYPEPSTSYTEPSTSRASLNFQKNVLSLPPHIPSPLPFAPLEASSPTLGASSNLLPQPSTSSAPGPFSTSSSQRKDDNISTTSGFSSRASDRDVPTSKTASLPKLWSREMDWANSRPPPYRSSRKRLQLDPSLFGKSSNSTFNRTALNSSDLGYPPLYPEKTTYGGRAASRSPHRRPETPFQTPVRRAITAKPARAPPFGEASAKCRRILNALESMSSPVASTFNRTALNSSDLGYPPLYPEKTTYGGRAASRSPHRRPETPFQTPVRRAITAKPARAPPLGEASAKCRRNLNALESMSRPVADAKKIPIRVSIPLSPSVDGTNLDASHSEPKRKRMVSALPPVQKMVVPAAASVSGNCSVSFCPTSTPGEVGQDVDMTPIETPTRHSPQLPKVDPALSQSTSVSSGPEGWSFLCVSSTPPADTSQSAQIPRAAPSTFTFTFGPANFAQAVSLPIGGGHKQQ